MTTRNVDNEVRTPWQAGTRILGINLSVVAAWIGPLLVTAWFLAWAVSLDSTNDRALDPPALPLDVVQQVLTWGGWSTSGVDSVAQWISRRPAIGPLAVAGVAFGVSLRHGFLIAMGLLMAIQSLGLPGALVGVVASTLVIAMCGALLLNGQDGPSESVLDRLRHAARVWFVNVVLEVCAMPILLLLGISHLLMERYNPGEPPYTSADQLSDDISDLIPDGTVPVSALSADSAARALAVVLAATSDSTRADAIAVNSNRLRRKRPIGAVNMHDAINKHVGPWP